MQHQINIVVQYLGTNKNIFYVFSLYYIILLRSVVTMIKLHQWCGHENYIDIDKGITMLITLHLLCLVLLPMSLYLVGASPHM
jgi:hypothetical protein